ncbi:MAG: hypothetical protein M1829_002085 [Trizodia sp. TS-e1964]|nr:MAG: hypothetical protein M1829_002085 [Trizodia sp. TS-e1964]
MASPTAASPPSLLAAVVATAGIAGLVGYFLGLGASLGLFGPRPLFAPKKHNLPRPGSKKDKNPSTSSDPDSVSEISQESDDEPHGDISAFTLALAQGEECKLNLVCSHATLLCYQALAATPAAAPLLKRWESHGQTKVATQVRSEDEMLELQAKALSLGLVARVVKDAGRTQIAPGSRTVLGVGPGPRSVVDAVTRGLKLL